jgi:branched-chain amino acid transport system ATP-binding protein
MTSTWGGIMPDEVLQIEGLHVSYGGSQILQGVDLLVGAESLSIVGRNGMGKTTLCQAILGLAPIKAGRIRFKGEDIAGLRPHEIARRGIGYVPQGRRIFPSLNVEEHLHLAFKGGRECRWTVNAIYELFPRLKERRRNSGAKLSGGEQQMLAISRALLVNPKLIVMDEPTEGLAPVIVDNLVNVFRVVAESGVAVLLVEQNFMVATSVSNRLSVMVNGVIALNTTSAAILADESLQRTYLGVSAHSRAA